MALTTPSDGLIIRRDGEIGQFIPAGQAVFYLSCCAPLRVSAEVDEEDIARVQVGQKVVLRADALPGVILDGKVSEITPKGDPVARSYRVRVKLADPSQLKVGMTVDANLIVAERPDALLVPATAVQDNAVWTSMKGSCINSRCARYRRRAYRDRRGAHARRAHRRFPRARLARRPRRPGSPAT
jgi:multidrug efflux pump subunit AcrA (membrane-fusion protein)